MDNKLKGVGVVWLSKTDLTNLNAGEGEENLIDVKKYSVDGIEYPYVSGQAMRYYLKEAIRRNLEGDEFMCVPDAAGVPSCLKQVEKMEEYSEKWKEIISNCLTCDLFGFMKPFGERGAVTRVSPVKVSPAIGLLPFEENSTIDFLTRQHTEKVGERIGGDIVNVEIGTNIYKCGIAIDLRRVGGEEDWSEGTVEVNYTLNEEQRIERVKKVLDSLKYLADYSKQARLLTDFTPDIICIAFQNKYSHRLQKLFELDNKREINIQRLREILSDIQQYSEKILFGMISGVIANEEDIRKVLEEYKLETKTPKEAIDEAITSLK